MSEIQRYACALDESGTAMDPAAFTRAKMVEAPLSGEYVRFTDHEAERAENLATIDFLNKELRSAVDALADAKARIEDLHYGDDNLLIGTGYQLAVNDALAALTQPQTERCPEDCDGFGRLIGDSDGPCPACSGLESDGGGAATAAGVADALTLTPGEARNLVDAAMGDEHDPQLLDSTVKRIGDEADRQLAEPGPYAKTFRERVCPVPEFPGIKNRQEDQA